MKTFKFVLVERLYADRSEAKKILNLNYEIWSNMNEKVCRAKRGLKKTTLKLKEGLKSSILGPQNLGSGGGRAPRAPLDPLVRCIVRCIFMEYKYKS